MLPPLRGGELVVLPEGVLADLSEPLAEVLGSLREAGVAAAIVVEGRTQRLSAPMPVLAASGAAAAGEIESALNRSLTELRGELYRAGAELGRVVSRLTAAGASPEELVQAAGAAPGLGLALVSGAGAASPPPGGLLLPVRPGLALAAWPERPRDRALASVALETLAGPIQEALRRAEDVRPRGPARAAAIRDLLLSDPGAGALASAEARRLGLDADGDYRAAAILDGEVRDLEAAFGRTATVHDAGEAGPMRLALLEWEPASPLAALAPVTAALERLAQRRATVALSRPRRFVQLALAGREARLLAALQAAGEVARRPIALDDPSGAGAFSLLTSLAGAEELQAFRAAVLDRLLAEDRRGELRRTLKVFLECGGAHGATAERLGIHRNTLAYRMRRISAAAGVDIADPATWITLQLAVMATAIGDAEEKTGGSARGG